MKQLQTLLALSTFSVLTLTSFHIPAWAVDANSFTERLQNNLKSSGWTFSASKSETDGSDIVLHDIDISVVTHKQEQPDNQETASNQDQSSQAEPPFKFDKVEELRFRNVTEDKDGNYLAENVTLPILTSENNNFKIFIEDLNFSDIELASDKNSDPVISYLPYQRMTIGQLYLTHDDQTFLLLDQLAMQNTPQPDKKLIDIKAGVRSFNYDPEKTGLPGAAKWLNSVGYNNFAGSFQSHALWDVENGKYNADRNEIVIKNSGKLNINLNLEGITEDFVQSIATLRKTVFAEDHDENALLIGYLGIIQQIKFVKLKIRYDDNSLTNRILDYFAEQNNVSRADFIKQLKTTLPIIGTQINYPEFVKTTNEQLATFLDNPKSLTISATPDKSVSLPILMATGTASHAQLIDLLKVKVEANK
ncbi:hypothetical protein [uncultured Bartonella sp.]|uniref:hypothetical protein n=1 Tax=uncultured Bartonella sp. TaxID=104108 RepID=UPI0026109E95|nr:hypothetical protein [uncultured Bartonella sp.]